MNDFGHAVGVRCNVIKSTFMTYVLVACMNVCIFVVSIAVAAFVNLL